MPLLENVNSFTYSTGKTEDEAFRKGNWWIGTNDVGKGPTVGTGSISNFWNGFNQSGDTGYVTYEYKSTQGASIRYPKTAGQLIIYTNQIASPSVFTTVEECFNWFSSSNDKILLNGDIPAVITSGATLYLEPRNVICNPRNDKWMDLTQKLRFDAISAQLTVTNFEGYFGFAFNGNDYWSYGIDPSLVDMGGDCTLIMWIYCSSTNSDTRTIFEKEGTVYTSQEQEICVDWNPDTSFTWYSRYDVSLGPDVGTIPAIGTVDKWQMVSIKMSTGKTSAARHGYYSINGSAWVSSYTSNTGTAVTAAGPVNICGGYSGVVETASNGLGMVMTYNRMLSDYEIYLTFQATKPLYNT
jgi:hypothetical protein